MTSSFRFMRRDSSRLSWRGPRPGSIASTVTEHRRSPGTSWPEWSPRSAIARGAGAYVIGTGRAADRQTALDFGANEFVDLENEALEDVGGVDLVFDVIGGDIQKRSAGVIRAGGTLVTIAGPTGARPADGLAVDFVVESDRAQLGEIVQRVRDGRLRTNIGNVAPLDDAVAAFNATERRAGKTVIRVRP